MAHINDLLQSPLTTTTQAGRTVSTQTTTEIPSQDRDFVNRLFVQLQAIFPAWRAAFPNDAAVAEARRQWTAGLVQSGIVDGETIKGGLRVARRTESPFLPSVGQFVGWCKQAKTEALQIPSRSEVQRQIIAYGNALSEQSIHPFTYWVRQNMDLYRWRRESAEKADKILDAVYAEALKLAHEGFVFPDPPVLIAAKTSTDESTPEKRKAAAEARAAALALFRLDVEGSADEA